MRYLFGDTPWDTGISPPELLEYIDRAPAGRALDLGCGTGTNSIRMAWAGWTVVGVDLSRLAIRRARQKARQASVTVDFRRLNVVELPGLIGPFDLALDIGCFHSLENEERLSYLNRLLQLLPPGADYLLYTFLAASGDGQAWPPSEADIHRLFDSSFSVLSLQHGTDRDRPSAWFHMRRKPS
ncbi:MAG: class I SAM-dependent methyltransferase [Anaerolineales bacterium]